MYLKDTWGLDIGPKTVELFQKNLKVLRQLSGMALWVYSKCLSSQKVLKSVCSMLANLKGANTIIGGGGSAAVKQLGIR